MKSLNDILDQSPAIEVGAIIIRPQDEFCVWLEDESGEGLSVDKKVLEGYLLRCIRENF